MLVSFFFVQNSFFSGVALWVTNVSCLAFRKCEQYYSNAIENTNNYWDNVSERTDEK